MHTDESLALALGLLELAAQTLADAGEDVGRHPLEQALAQLRSKVAVEHRLAPDTAALVAALPMLSR